MLRGLRVTGIRCEVEADDEIVWRDEAGTAPGEQLLEADSDVSVGPLQMRLEAAPDLDADAAGVRRLAAKR